MLPDRVSNPGPLTYESGVLPIALRGPAPVRCTTRRLSARLPYVNYLLIVRVIVRSSQNSLLARNRRHFYS